MSVFVVRSQAELDVALAEHRDDVDARIEICSDPGVWLWVDDTGKCVVTAWGDATVEAGGDATVEAWDSATVTAGDSATVRAWGDATVRAWGSATVTAGDSATVEAWDSATVRAWGSATVRAWGDATVTAGKYVAIHLHSANAKISGGILIDVTKISQTTDPQEWADYTGARVEDDKVFLYKAVTDDYRAGLSHTPTTYTVGETVTCTDWDEEPRCGGGLHASPHRGQALSYARDAKRMLIVSAPLASIVPIPGGTAKCKAPSFVVVREVPLSGPMGEEMGA